MMFRRRRWLLTLGLIALIVLALGACAAPTQPAEEQPAAEEPMAEEEPMAAEGQLEIFSWWTAGGEADGLEAMFDIYREHHPGVEIINATVAGGAGTNAQAVLKTRMQGGDPPDSFQVHGGEELIDTWVVPGMMESVTFVYEENDWLDQYPQDLKDMVSSDGELWSVPVNVHRGNVLFYNQAIFDEYGLDAPQTVDDFFAVAGTLQENGVTPLALGDTNKWPAAHLFEDVLLGVLGPEGYRGLWTGETSWTGPEVEEALNILSQMLDYANEDHAALTWDGAAQLLVDGTAAMTVMGDWAAGYFTAQGWEAGTDYGWAASPGTEGSFMVVTDTFGLPEGAPDRENAVAWLRVAGSKEGQEAFNPKKGSICARLDCDPSIYDAYLTWSAEDFATNHLTPSEAHGSAAPQSFVTPFNDTVNIFVTDRDVQAAQESLQSACEDADMCQ